MPIATVTSKGQITIPAEVRARLGLLPGSRVAFVEGPDGTYEMHPEGVSLRDTRGIIAAPGKPVTIEEMNEAIAESAVQSGK